jgi:predicted phage-related endonuclease
MIDHDLRRKGISGSDVAAIFGCDEWRDAFSVWLEKKENLPPCPPTPRMRLGKALERGIIEYYSEISGHKAEWCDMTLQHPARPFQIGTPDALCMEERRGVDAKLVFWDQRKKWGETVAEIPLRVQFQASWYMSLLDYDLWDVAALVGQEEPRIYTLERDREAERVMLARVEEWYRRYLLGNEQPPMGGGDDASRWLQQTFPKHRRPDLRAAHPDEVIMLDEYVQIRLEQNELAPRRAVLENELKLAIGAQEGLVWPGGKFTWRRCKDSLVTDWESMALALLIYHIKDEKAREVLLNDYTRTKPGTRRIRLDCDLMREQDAA